MESKIWCFSYSLRRLSNKILNVFYCYDCFIDLLLNIYILLFKLTEKAIYSLLDSSVHENYSKMQIDIN